MVLPPALQAYQVDLIGRLVTSEAPGVEIKALREHVGFTQEWLANLLGLRRESLSRIEGGHVDLSIDFLRQFGKIMTLAHGVREHLASLETRMGAPDERYFEILVGGLRLDARVSEEVILQSVVAYEAKRRQALAALRPDPLWQETRRARAVPHPRDTAHPSEDRR
ncbi:MAG: helix-turn-helix domain-containing protein [Thermoplasmatota archaeon]